MKRYSLICLFAALLMPLALVSCSEDDNTVEEFPNWMEANTDSISRLYDEAGQYADGSWKLFLSYALEDTVPTTVDDYIAVQVLEEGAGSGCPMFTDSVRISYRGRLIPSTSYVDGYVFDQTYSGEYNSETARPQDMYVGSLVDGFATALQHMHIGDHWRVYIPYMLGYGSSGTTTIPAYSTLVFDIALVAYCRADGSLGPTRSAESVWITE